MKYILIEDTIIDYHDVSHIIYEKECNMLHVHFKSCGSCIIYPRDFSMQEFFNHMNIRREVIDED
jgi:hypothetical protein